MLGQPSGCYRPLCAGSVIVGWLDDARAETLAAFGDVFEVDALRIAFRPVLADCTTRTAAMETVTRALSGAARLSAWRDERYAVADRFGGEPLFLIERAAARFFGIKTYAAHINGLVAGTGVAGTSGVGMWIARRSAFKGIDPGMLDNLVGGGIAAGATVRSTLIKEAWEEAGIPEDVASMSKFAGDVRICRAQPDGLQRETVFVHDLWLAEDFVPDNQDGEAVEHRIVDLAQASALIAQQESPDVVTADASLVILDFLLRHGALDADAAELAALDALRVPMLELTQTPGRPAVRE
jgi:8-oxo-dGTP pyrophosphatase MutT (NUDIX family)